MKVEFDKNKYIRLIAETNEEAYAIRYILDNFMAENQDTPMGGPIIIDCSILNETE